MMDLLFSVPWWIPTAIIIVGLILMISGNRRQRVNVRTTGLCLIAFSILWSIVSYLVDTPKEVCRKQTQQFVDAVVDREWNRFDGFVSQDVQFTFNGTSWRIAGRDTLDHAIRADIDHIGLRSARVRDIQAADRDRTITVSFTVWTDQTLTMDQPIQSDWEMDWRQVDGRWLLHEIRAMRVANVSAEQIRGSLPVR